MTTILSKGWVRFGNAVKQFVALLDCGAQLNLISQKLVTQWDLEPVAAHLPTPGAINGTDMYCYGAYQLKYWLVDSWGQGKECCTLFYAVDLQGQEAILGMPGLSQLRVVIDPEARQWRFKVNPARLEVDAPAEFAQGIGDKSQVYALICAAVAREDPEDLPPPEIPKELSEYEDVFSKELAGHLPALKQGDHAIDVMEGKEPPYGPLYNLSQTELAELRRYLEDALKKNWIQHSTSPAGAPILFVPKKDGGLRLCVDYRGLNAVTIKNRHPLPLITETLDRLCGAQRFTKLDLKDAYHRIRIRSGDEWKTAFRTRYGHFEYLVMPFGLANAPATFQAYINRALAGLVDIICVVYLDDILIYSAEEAEHWKHVKRVLERLRNFALYASLKKCQFNTTKVEFLGFVVSTDGVAMDQERVATVKDWPKPQTYREVQVFLGFANFYRRFIYRYSNIAAPLTNLLKGSKDGKKPEPLEWSEKAQNAFDQLRDAFSSAPFLRHFDPNRKLRMETDASNFALGAILSQQDEDGHWRPVAYWSRKMIPAEQNYEVHDQELLAIVAAMKQWRHYLEGSAHCIDILTDHHNLKAFMKQKALNPRQARWALRLAAYDFEIFHRPGKLNPADAPSRRPDYEGASPLNTTLLPTLQNKLSLWEDKNDSRQKELIAAMTPAFQIAGIQVVVPRREIKGVPETAYEEPKRPMKSLIRQLQPHDKWMQSFKENMGPTQERPRNRSQAWNLDSEGLLRHNNRLYIPCDQGLREELINNCHDDPLAGHFGAAKTQELLSRKYYWNGMTDEVAEYVKSCDVCQRTKSPRHRPYGQLGSLPVTNKPWKELSMDFVTGLPPSKYRGKVYDAILVVVDRFTKMVRYLPTTTTIDAAELAELFYAEIVCRYGTPAGVVSDRGSLFTSAYWSAICYHAKIKRRLSTAFHPQTDGQTERQNQVLEHYLRTFTNAKQSNWSSLLPMAEFAYMNSWHSSIGTTPFFLMYGYHPEINWEIEDDSIEGEVPAANEKIRSMQALRDETAERLRRANDSQAKHYNKLHKEQTYKVGDLVMLATKNLKQKRPSKKLSHKFIGPFRIVDKVGAQAYRLLLPSTFRIHNTFHVSLLEPYRLRDCADASEVFMQAPELIDDEELWEVEEIVDKVKNKQGVWFKVKWTGWGEVYNQWLPDKELDGARELVHDFEQSRSRREAIEPVQEEIENEDNYQPRKNLSRRKRHKQNK